MTKKLILIALLAVSTNDFLKAQDAPTAAPEVKGFSLSPDNIGAAANSVNLFTGDLHLPVSLVSLPGRNGLDVNVSISYSSNVQNQVDTWNLEAPTGILGLGWNMDVPKIVVDTKQTGTKEDDTYYLIEGGTSNRLIRTTSGNDAVGWYYVYETKNYQFWKIKFYYDLIEVYGSAIYGSGPNRWEIIKENGFKYVYGDKNSGRRTLQYLVRWENWIGNSSQTVGQSQLVSAWNLSEIVNLQGEKVLFEYDNEEQYVGSASGQKHTEASYLKQITDPIGRKVQFVYLPKASIYYMEPHTEQAEPDAYQEVYEKKYLDHIDVMLETGIKQLSVNFRYSSVNSGTNTAKMLLAKIEQRNTAGNALPGTSFDYYLSTDTNGYKGFLQKITFPTGGTTSYSYKMTDNTIWHSKRDLIIYAPPGFAEPRVWQGGDYVVVTWRAIGGNNSHDSNPRDVKLFVYQWVGEWKEQFLQTIGNVALEGDANPYKNYKDFQVVLEANFFAVLSRPINDTYHFFLRYKDEKNRGNWLNYDAAVDYGSGLPTLMSGSDFVVVGSNYDDSTHPCHLYTFQGNTWKDDVLNQTSGDHFYTASNNFFFSHNRVGTSGNAEMNFNYLKEDKNWVTKPWLTSLTFGVSNLQNNKSYWHSSNSLIVAMANDNPEYAYRWDLTYTNFFKDTKDINNNDLFGRLSDDLPVHIINNSMVGINGRLARYDGKYWLTENITSTHNSIFGSYFSYGDDIVVRPVEFVFPNYKGGRKIFNPNSLTWEPDFIMDGVDRGLDRANVGIDYYYFGNGYYYRSPSGTWSKKYTYPNSNDRVIKSGFPRFDVVSDVYPFNIREIRSFKNGEIVSVADNSTGLYLVTSERFFPTNGVGSQTIVLSPSSDFTTSTYLYLKRIVNEKDYDKQVDYPVSLITTNDGTQDRYTSIDYRFSTAAIDPSGTIAQYNQVSVIPGTSTPSIDMPFGYTTTYFNNGLTNFDDPGIPYNPPIDGFFHSIDLHWLGQPYQIQVFDKNNLYSPVSITDTYYKVYPKPFSNPVPMQVEVGYYVRPEMVRNLVDGIATRKQYSYADNSGLVTKVEDKVAQNLIAQTEYTYWWEKYDPTNMRNILTPVIQTSLFKNSSYVESNVKRYKNWNANLISSTLPAEADSYVWKGTGAAPNTFSTWDASITPPADWQYAGKIVKRDDNTGAVLETSAKGNISSAIILDLSQTKPIAQISNATYSKVAYSSFEPNHGNGNWEASGIWAMPQGPSKTGDYYLDLDNSGLTKSGLSSTEKYTVSFWAKTNSGSVIIDGIGTVNLGALADWTLFEYTITGLTAFNIRKSGTTQVSIDEIRFHPVNARMTTTTYHPLYGPSSNTDANNQITFIEYDEFGRVKNALDENRHIVKANSYNIKK